MHHAEAQTGGAKTIRAMYFARVDDYDFIGSDMLRFAVVMKLHNAGINQPNGEFFMPMRFKREPEDVFRMKGIDASP
jgi:hypothetical protein